MLFSYYTSIIEMKSLTPVVTTPEEEKPDERDNAGDREGGEL